MKIAIFAVIALLSGCETIPPAPQPPAEDFQRELAAALDLLQGLDIKTAVMLFGYPDSEQQLAGDKVEFWGFVQFIPMFQDTPPIRIACTIQIGTDSSGTITHTHWEGDRMGCAHYVRGYQR